MIEDVDVSKGLVAVVLAVSTRFPTLRVGNCLVDDFGGRATFSPAILTILSDAVVRIASAACSVTTGGEGSNATVVDRKAEMESLEALTVVGVGAACSESDVMGLIKLVIVLANAVTVFVSSFVSIMVRITCVVVRGGESGELPSTATIEYEARFWLARPKRGSNGLIGIA